MLYTEEQKSAAILEEWVQRGWRGKQDQTMVAQRGRDLIPGAAGRWIYMRDDTFRCGSREEHSEPCGRTVRKPRLGTYGMDWQWGQAQVYQHKRYSRCGSVLLEVEGEEQEKEASLVGPWVIGDRAMVMSLWKEEMEVWYVYFAEMAGTRAYPT